ncbi:MAG: hypothetical protein C0598_03415 [Marinilabiliales bacterium]|nr:MAG: hypothetical protein C0598_03415 [Marinilabiliales bacterium]
MRSLTKLIVLSLIIVFPVSPIFSQTFEDFKDQIREDYNTFEKETQQKFNTFVETIDKEFADYLSENFGSYNIGHEKYIPGTPKPELMPEIEITENEPNRLEYELTPESNTYQSAVYPGIKKSEDESFPLIAITVRFLGWPLEFKIDEAFNKIEFTNPSAENISNYWEQLGKVNYNHFLYQVSEVSNTLNLNQWGYYQLLKAIGEELYPGNRNQQVLFQWAMLNRSRYKSKIGFNNNDLFLLVPSVHKMYNVDFVNINNISYYVLESKGAEINTYAKDFPESDIIMDVTIKSPFYTDPIKKSKDFKFTYNKEEYILRLDFDGEMIKFYETIPLSDVSIYFNSLISNRTKNSILKAFTPILNGKTDFEKVNILLSFVQQAFDYKTDQQAYGTERYFFPDEMLNYPYADCEDRAILLNYLIKQLIKTDVVALSFPGHMACGVKLNGNNNGTYVNYLDARYYIADPTLMGAHTGVLMPGLNTEETQLIALTNDYLRSVKASKIWSKTKETGGFKASNLKDLVFDNQGNAYVCGYFTNTINYKGEIFQTNNNDRDVFVIKYDNNLNPLWLKTAIGKGNDLGLSLTLDSDNMLYVYGSFENDLSFGNISIEAIGAPDIFIAKYDSKGEILWAKKGGLDKLDHSIDLIFAAKFDPFGEKIMAKLYSETENFSYYGIEMDSEDNALIKGSFFSTTGMNNNDYVNYNFEGDLENVPEVLYLTDKKLKEKEYEETIAGLFAALNLLNANTVEINGNNITKAFDEYNHKIKKYAESLYNSFKGMKFLKNEKGIISIKTSNSEPVIMDKIKITNDARIRVIRYKSGNILVEVLSGVYVGGGDYWLDMNSIKLFKESGDILLNFDTDNTVQKINLRKEILKY